MAHTVIPRSRHSWKEIAFSVGSGFEKHGFGFNIHERWAPFPSQASTDTHFIAILFLQLFILLISAAEGPSAIGASWGTWQDFSIHVDWWVWKLFTTGVIPYAGNGRKSYPVEVSQRGMNLRLGSEQLQSFWEVKGEVLQHTQPGD